MRDDQAYARAAVGERQHREVPGGPVFGIHGRAGLLGEPSVELGPRPRRRDDLEFGHAIG
ncbi:hypothetical protein MSIMFI_05184 [Mycobacterium simulans]|nr:hypothetical protein MSIMFI_05184 [Mycobacterium simulans]